MNYVIAGDTHGTLQHDNLEIFTGIKMLKTYFELISAK